MGVYTVLEDANADKAVEEVLDLVVKRVLETVGERRVKAIVLIGGFGRGEGGVYLDGDSYRLVNDVNLLVFVNGFSYFTEKKKIEKSLRLVSDEVVPYCRGLKQVDISLAKPLALKSSPNLVSHYEIREGHKVVYGRLNTDSTFKRIDPTRLSPYDGAILFRNRGSCLLATGYYIVNKLLDREEFKENLQIEIQKSCIAMGDSILFLDGKYHFSYRERLKRFNFLKSDTMGIPADLFENVRSLYNEAVPEKLQPRFDDRADQRIVDKWFVVRQVFSDFFLWFESQRLGIIFTEWLDYSRHVRKQGLSAPFDIKLRELFRGMTNKKSAVLSFFWGNETPRKLDPTELNAILPLLLFSLRQDSTFDLDLLKEARGYFRETANVDRETWSTYVREYTASVSHWGGMIAEINTLAVAG